MIENSYSWYSSEWFHIREMKEYYYYIVRAWEKLPDLHYDKID